MCGRYRLSKYDKEYLWHWFGIDAEYVDEVPDGIFEAWPATQLPIIRLADGKPTAQSLRWGFIEKHLIEKAKKGDGRAVINGTTEKLLSHAMYRKPFEAHQRAIVPATSFFEFPGGQRHEIGLEDWKPFGFAGLYKTCKNREGEAVPCFTFMTVPANTFMEPLHPIKLRMPVILTEAQFQGWLSRDTPVDDLLAMLTPYAGKMIAQPVKKEVKEWIPTGDVLKSWESKPKPEQFKTPALWDFLTRPIGK